MSTLRILADENIPFVHEAFGGLGEVVTMPGRAIGADVVRSVDVLLVRSVTRVDETLLQGSTVRFVGTATSGTDHVDTEWLSAHGIAFAHAAGANARSVVDYILAALYRLAARRDTPLKGKTIGIVGAGHIGGELARRLPMLGMNILVNDPPLARAAERAGRTHPFVPLDQVLAQADIVTLHVPLTTVGPHPTAHLIDARALARLQPGTWLLNTARGPVVDNPALGRALDDGIVGAAVLDVWEGEPYPDPELIEKVDVGTPHIAGYAYDGKVEGTLRLYHALTSYLGVEGGWDHEAALAPLPGETLELEAPPEGLEEHQWFDALIRQMYDIGEDDRRFRALSTLPHDARGHAFARQRKTYPRRRAFSRFSIEEVNVPSAYRQAVARGIGVSLR